MIDEHTQELIQAGVDGELDDAGKAELGKVLETSAEARRFHSELVRLAGFLDSIPGREMPAGLHARIVQGIDLPTQRKRKSLFELVESAPLLRYGFAGVAALVLAVVISMNRDDLGATSDVSSMVGTMTSPLPEAQMDIVDRFTIDAGSMNGLVTLERREAAMVVNIDVEAVEDFELEVDLAGSGLMLDAFAQMNSQLDSISFNGEKFNVSGQGRQQFVLILNPGAGSGKVGQSRIDLVVKQQGAQVQSGSLDLGGASI